MTSAGPAGAAGGDEDLVDRLFREYLESLDDGPGPDLDALLTRAGERADELRRRVRVLEILGGTDGPPAALPAGPQRLGRFEDLRLLGGGGISHVYLAYDPDLRREVALKVLRPELVSSESSRSWLLQEGRTLAQLQHDGVVRVFDTGEDAGLAFIAMERVVGPSLEAVIAALRERAQGRPAPEDAQPADPALAAAVEALQGIGARVELALGIARALQACHERGVLHRDVKPANVLLPAPREPKLIDFGLAHLDAPEGSLNRVTQRLVGTPAYLAPEQVESERTGSSPLSDQFSFGVVLYELLTLRAPFTRSTRTQTLDAVALAAPEAPRRLDAEIPPDLEQVCLHALEREPGDRYPSMRALADDLEAFLDHRAVSVTRPSAARRARLWLRRNRRDVLLVLVPAVVLVVGLAGWAVASTRSAHAALAEEIERNLAGVPALQEPVGVLGAYGVTARLRERAASVDGGLLARLLLPSLATRCAALTHAVSRRLHELVEEGLGRVSRDDLLLAEQAEAALIDGWRPALAMDAELCPECPYNDRERSRGQIALPVPPDGTTLRVWRMLPRGPDTVLEEIAPPLPRLLREGTYRVAWLGADGAPELEISCWTTSAHTRKQVELAPVPPALRAQLVRVPAGELVGAGPHRGKRVPAFWVLPRWVTNGDVLGGFGAGVRFPGADDPRLVRLADAAPDAPVQAKFAFAEDVATRLSVRLPSVDEVLRLRDLAAAAGAASPELPEGFAGEYCSGVRMGLQRMHLARSSPGRSLALQPIADPGQVESGPFAFRLVLSATD